MTENNIQKREDSNLTLIERLKLRRMVSNTALLLDVSGSMATDIEPGKSRINALRDIVSSINGNPPIFWFSGDFGECTKNTVPDVKGATNLAALLMHIKTRNIKSVIILTDGEITDQAATRIAKQDLDIKVMYIGSGNRPKFLDELASSGFATTEDLKQTKELLGKIQLLLK